MHTCIHRVLTAPCLMLPSRLAMAHQGHSGTYPSSTPSLPANLLREATMTPVALPRLAVRVLPLRSHLELAALPSAVACARGHVRSVVLEWGMPDLADTAALVTTELVTNAIRASESLRINAALDIVPVVRISLVSDRVSILLRVWDGGDGTPVRHDAGPADESGRGLMIIDTLGAEWGAYRTPDGKIVWVIISPETEPPLTAIMTERPHAQARRRLPPLSSHDPG
jgi:anti-sigma regulatory factor (Ser/Thr protein kinase)